MKGSNLLLEIIFIISFKYGVSLEKSNSQHQFFYHSEKGIWEGRFIRILSFWTVIALLYLIRNWKNWKKKYSIGFLSYSSWGKLLGMVFTLTRGGNRLMILSLIIFRESVINFKSYQCWQNGFNRPVLKHGPRSLTCMRVFEWLKLI